MALTANIFLLRENSIENKRLVFHMDLVDEVKKSKELIKSRIIKAFNNFGVDEQALKSYISITIDTGLAI